MFLLYVDESGDVNNPDDHFVVGGFAVHEARVRDLNRRIEEIAGSNLAPHLADVLELHAQEIRSGKEGWRGIPREVKANILREIPAAVGGFGPVDYALFAVARAPDAVPEADPLERSFEELLLRFTQMLIRINRAGRGRDEHGIVIADKARYEATLQPLVQKWRTDGTRFARLGRLVEVPLFIDSRATRLTQAADFVAHATYRFYRDNDDAMFAPMLDAFDSTPDGVRHGLVHLAPNYYACDCPACVSRVAVRRRPRWRRDR